MAKIIMQRGAALWLAKKTKLSNRQIAEFSNLHELEINAFRNPDVQNSIIEINPIDSFLLSEEMIKECEQDALKNLKPLVLSTDIKNIRKNRSYAKKHEIVNAVFWLITKYPNLQDEGIIKLLNCTKTLIQSIRNKTYKEYENLSPRHPVTLELCNQTDLEIVLTKYKE